MLYVQGLSVPALKSPLATKSAEVAAGTVHRVVVDVLNTSKVVVVAACAVEVTTVIDVLVPEQVETVEVAR